MPAQVDPRYFDFGGRFMEGVAQANEQKRQNALMELQQRQAGLAEKNYGLQERRVGAEEARLSQADAERQRQMDEQLKKESQLHYAMAAVAGDHRAAVEFWKSYGFDDEQAVQISQLPDAAEVYAEAAGMSAKPPSSFQEWQLAQGNPGYAEWVKSQKATNAPDPYFQMIPTAGGAMRFNARTGQMEPITVDGKPVIPSASDPTLQGDIALAKKRGAVLGEAWGGAEVNLPQVIDQANQSIQTVRALLTHPGFKTAVGATLLPGSRFVPGSDASNFMRRLEQVQGGAFLDAYKTLKGGGQITEIEGKKATDAITRMSISQSEEEFRTAAQDYIDVINAAVERTKNIAAKGQSFGNPPSAPQRTVPQEFDYVPGRGLVPRT